MSLPNQLDLLVDTEGNKLLNAFTSTRAALPPVLTVGDTVPVTVRVLRKSVASDPDYPWSEIALPNHNIRLTIGHPGKDPTAGTFTITLDGDTTSALGYAATAAQVQTALNALASVQAAGNTTVTAFTQGGYRIAFGNTGAVNAITTDVTTLYPTTQATVTEHQAGDGSNKEIQLLTLQTNAAATILLTDTLDTAGATITTTRQGVTNTTAELQTLTLDPVPYAGTYTLTTTIAAASSTGALAWNAPAATIQSALIATDTTNLTGKVTVTGTFPGPFTIQFDSSLGNVAAITADVSTLTVPTGRKGDFALTASGLTELLSGKASNAAVLQCEIINTTSSTGWTPLQTPITVRQSV